MSEIEPHEHIQGLTGEDRAREKQALEEQVSMRHARTLGEHVYIPETVEEYEFIKRSAKIAQHTLETGGDPELRDDEI